MGGWSEKWKEGEIGAELGEDLARYLFGTESSEQWIARKKREDEMTVDWGDLLGQGMTMYRDYRSRNASVPYYLEAPAAPYQGPMMTGRSYRRRRRMNPLNPRAARRAISRIKSLRKLTRSIEAQLPKVRVKPKLFGRRR